MDSIGQRHPVRRAKRTEKPSRLRAGFVAVVTVAAAISLGIGAAVMWPKLTQSPWDSAHQFPQSFPLEASDSTSPTWEGDLEFFAEAVRQLREKNEQLTAELSEVSEELAVRKSEVSFSFGTIKDAGTFVGRTLRQWLDLEDLPELQALEAETFNNQLDVLSLGPFIREADVLESDPLIFAQFQSNLIGEMLLMDARRRTRVARILESRKTESLEFADDDQSLIALNDITARQVTSLLTDFEQIDRAKHLAFLRHHGMLMIPAYAVLD